MASLTREQGDEIIRLLRKIAGEPEQPPAHAPLATTQHTTEPAREKVGLDVRAEIARIRRRKGLPPRRTS